MVSQIFLQDPGWEIQKEFWFEIFERLPVGIFRRFFGCKFESKWLSETDGDVVRRSKIEYPSVKCTGPVFLNVCNGCEVGSLFKFYDIVWLVP